MAHSATDVDEVIAILSDSLQLGGRAQQLTVSSRLLGTIPELDSMAIVGVLTAIEERYGFTIDDDGCRPTPSPPLPRSASSSAASDRVDRAVAGRD
jgi:acyl carrier protein